MDAGVEHLEVLRAERLDVSHVVTDVLGDHRVEVVEVLIVHAVSDAEILVAHCGEVSVIAHAVNAEPPAAQHGGHEGGHEATDVDEHVENLEAGVTLGSVLGVVIELSDDGLEVALEEAVAECDQEQSHASDCEEPAVSGGSGEDGDGEDDVAGGHHQEAGDDGTLIVLSAVSDYAADEAEHVDAGVEEGVYEGALLLGEAEFGTQEQHEHGVHDVIAKALAHVAEGGGYQAGGLVFKHSWWLYSDWFRV